jgi:mono/diheme cytochrome c family protein
MFWCSYKAVIDMRFVTLLLIMIAPALAFADESPVAADAAAGKAVYSQTCIACHGANGKGTIPGVRAFRVQARSWLCRPKAAIQRSLRLT